MNYVIDNVEYSWNSSKNQRVRDRFVNREVIHSAGSLIWFLQEKNHYEELEELGSTEDWDDEIEAYLEKCMEEDKEKFEELDPEDQDYFEGKIAEIGSDYSLLCTDKEDVTAEEIIEELRDDGRLEEFGWDKGIEPYIREPLEFWAVSDYLARRLKAQGEVVADDVCGFTIWGRCTSGQAISMDGVIGRICFNEDLLEGQTYYRED